MGRKSYSGTEKGKGFFGSSRLHKKRAKESNMSRREFMRKLYGSK